MSCELELCAEVEYIDLQQIIALILNKVVQTHQQLLLFPLKSITKVNDWDVK